MDGYLSMYGMSGARHDMDEGEETKKTIFIGGRRQPKPMEVDRANAGARDPSAK